MIYVYPGGGQLPCWWPYTVDLTGAWRTNEKTNIQKRETRPRNSAGSWPLLPKFSGYVEVEVPDIFHPGTIWVRPLFTELGPNLPPPKKKPILPWSKRINVALAYGGLACLLLIFWHYNFVIRSVLEYACPVHVWDTSLTAGQSRLAVDMKFSIHIHIHIRLSCVSIAIKFPQSTSGVGLRGAHPPKTKTQTFPS